MRFLLIAALVASSVSFAQTSPGTTEKRQPKTVIIFDPDEDIGGHVVGPDGTVITGDSRPVFPNMIRIRQNFSDKLKASVNDLR
jgi:hypothetical protein